MKCDSVKEKPHNLWTLIKSCEINWTKLTVIIIIIRVSNFAWNNTSLFQGPVAVTIIEDDWIKTNWTHNRKQQNIMKEMC